VAFDKPTRNKLAATVAKARGLLVSIQRDGTRFRVEGEFARQFRSLYGIEPNDGSITPLAKLTHLDDTQRAVARLLRDRIDYLEQNQPDANGRAATIHRVLREQAFTVLNRFAALRMAEERGIIIQSVAKGVESKGFQVYENLCGPSMGDRYQQYRTYLFSIFDEISVDLGVLFDRFSPTGLLFPEETALNELLDAVNDPELAHLWAEDETVGWIYQYYNDPDERKAMRKVSTAPRNSRELAVRNQFFTPRYVVEFLVDNTLGRIWYEMCKGKTRLTERCRYLVRRPNEVFLDIEYATLEDSEDDWVIRYATSGNAELLPEDPRLEDLGRFALLINGYDWHAQLLGLDPDENSGCTQDFIDQEINPRLQENQDGAAPSWQGDALRLWCCLHSLQRGFLKEGRLPSGLSSRKVGTTSKEPVLAPLWLALRQALCDGPGGDLSQEELLQQPVFIPHRPLKAPRDIRLLDPACGSMHFGLYAFDLFESIYEEAWHQGHISSQDFGGPSSEFDHQLVVKKESIQQVTGNYATETFDAATARVVLLVSNDPGDGLSHGGPYLREPEGNFRPDILREMPLADFDYAEALHNGWMTEEQGERLVRETDAFEHPCLNPLPNGEVTAQFMREVPAMIIENNIHGVDIDPRAVQIAGLSLWLRAQKSWIDLPAAERPLVRRSNIVCAEPMPGSDAMLEDFIKTLDPPLLGELVKTVFDKMQLAGEAGTLLKIEEEIRSGIDDAKDQWEKLGTAERELFTPEELNQTLRPGTQQQPTGIEKALATDHRPLTTDFFDTAEERIYTALEKYAESAEADDYQRRLFADDAAHGFAFIDLCRKRYDAVVMNPPFGLPVDGQLEWLKSIYTNAYVDLYATMVSRGLSLCQDGLLGCITSRSFMFAKTLTDWRIECFLERVQYVADLGSPVMDAAVVESCAYVLASTDLRRPILVTDCKATPDKGRHLLETLDSCICDYVVDRLEIKQAFRGKFLYSIRSHIRHLFHAKTPKVGNSLLTARQGLKTFNDFRFLRTHWEVSPALKGKGNSWEPVTRGGGNELFYSDFTSVVLWRDDGIEPGAVNFIANGQTAQSRQASRFYRIPGATYTWRAASFKPAALPTGVIVGGKGPTVVSIADASPQLLVGVLSSTIMRALVALQANANQYETGIVEALPHPNLDRDEVGQIESLALDAIQTCRRISTSVDESVEFLPPLLGGSLHSLREEWAAHAQQAVRTVVRIVGEIDKILAGSLHLTKGDVAALAEAAEISPVVSLNHLGASVTELLISLCTACSLGRWDIRYATGERQPPELPDPFDPLPVCPPGMLQNADGLPAAPAEVPGDYPLRITWPGILVSDPGHPEDIVARVRDALVVIWGDRSAAIEQEACEILGVRTLCDYFAEKKSGGKFFKDHLKRYSKSRRKAPIYWPLSTASGSYTLWVYYHRLDDQFLYKAVNDFVAPKLEAVQRDLENLTGLAADKRQSDWADEKEKLELFEKELVEFRDELLRVAELPWKPNLNDGVQITAAPLWSLFRLKPWQKVLKETWEKLERGDYDWAHLAYSMWPDRVREKCKTDKSLAIAHDLEDVYIEPPPKPGKKTRKKKVESKEVQQDLLGPEEN